MNARSVALVSNLHAGKGRALVIVNQLRQRLTQLGISFSTFTGDWPADFNDFTEVWLVGGDGTLNHFINTFHFLTIPVALFKGGSGNDFAWKLYGNTSVNEYVEFVLKARPRRVDAGRCNGKYFINGVGAGFDGAVVKSMGNKRFLSAGHFAYLWVVVKKIFFYREKVLEVVWNGNVRNDPYFMVNVANGARYGGGFLVAPQASIEDGMLDIILIEKIGLLRRLFYLPAMEKGKHLGLSFIEFTHAQHIVITSPQSVPAHLDGELMESDHFEIEIIPGKFLFFF